jgi:hypothetical protein
VVKNEPHIALRLVGAADAFRVASSDRPRRGVPWTGSPAFLVDLYERLDVIAGGDARSHPDWLAGSQMSAEDAVDLALTMADVYSRPVTTII